MHRDLMSRRVLLRRISFRDATSQQRLLRSTTTVLDEGELGASKLDHERGRAKKTGRFLDDFRTFCSTHEAEITLQQVLESIPALAA